jgi:hypothetical protein
MSEGDSAHPPELGALLEQLERSIDGFQDALADEEFEKAARIANENAAVREQIRARFGDVGRTALGERATHPVPAEPAVRVPAWITPSIPRGSGYTPAPPPLGPDLAELLRDAQQAHAALKAARASARQAARERALRSETLAIGAQSQLSRCPWCQKLIAGPGDDSVESEGQRWHRRCRDRAGDLL